MGGGAGFDACDGPKQCVLTASTCCGVCGMPELANKVAVNQAALEAFRATVCTEPMGCPECAEEVNPNLFAYCDEGRCVAADARTHAVSECAQSSDCVLRYGMGCCESTCMGVESELTSVSVQGFQSMFDTLGCQSVACDDCDPTYPMFTEAFCNDDGHCEVGLLN